MNEPPASLRGVRCTILRQAGYTPGAWLLSDRYDGCFLFLEFPEPPYVPAGDKLSAEDQPYLRLVRRKRWGRGESHRATPLTGGPFAFGGNWLWSDDPAFPADHPIPIDDAPAPSGGEGS